MGGCRRVKVTECRMYERAQLSRSNGGINDVGRKLAQDGIGKSSSVSNGVRTVLAAVIYAYVQLISPKRRYKGSIARIRCFLTYQEALRQLCSLDAGKDGITHLTMPATPDTV
jgi:hypothetical protein